MDYRFLRIAGLWFASAFAVAALGAILADSRFVTNAWHVYFIAQSRGVLTTDSDVTWSEVYRLIMAVVGAFACILCFVSRFNTKSPRGEIATAPLTTWEIRATGGFALLLLIITLVAMPTNLYAAILENLGIPTQQPSLNSETADIRNTLLSAFPGGSVIVKSDPDFGVFSQAFHSRPNPAAIDSLALWRNPQNPTMGILVANLDVNSVAANSPDQASMPLSLESKTNLSSLAAGRLAHRENRSYFSEIWRPYLFPYSLYSIGLWLFIIYPVILYMVRSVKQDRSRFSAASVSRPIPPTSASTNSLAEYQKAAEHRLDAIRDVVSRYLAVFFVVCLVATVEFGVSYIRTSSLPEAATFGQIDLIVIWLSCLAIAAFVAVLYFIEYRYAFAGFESLEDISTGKLYQDVRTSKLSFREQYSSIKLVVTGGVAAGLLAGSFLVLKQAGTKLVVPAICGTLPRGIADQILRTGYASGFTSFPDCKHFTVRTK